MQTRHEPSRLRIELDIENCDLAPAEISTMEKKLEPLHEHAADFPVSDLYITITFHTRSNSYHVNLALVLTGKTLATATTAETFLTGVDTCVGRLVRRILQYKSQLNDTAELDKYRKGTQHDVIPDREPDADQILAAREASDYAAFRRALDPYEASLSRRIGRWSERFPELRNQLGTRWTLADFTEEVFLTAFEEFHNWPREVRLGHWLENLIPVALKAIAKNPDEEMSNIEFIRSALEVDQTG